MTVTYEPIGVIHTPFSKKEGTPIQPNGALGVKGKIIIKEEYCDGLVDLDGFSHIILVYHFHKSSGYDLRVTPFLDNRKRGLFSTRAPRRPNPIGMSVVRLLNIEGNTLYVENVDILNMTPLLDIKPYISGFDNHETEKNGWIENKTGRLKVIRADKRFE
jgi:tRNA (adenine37-N6)-methyltransferase